MYQCAVLNKICEYYCTHGKELESRFDTQSWLLTCEWYCRYCTYSLSQH